MDTKRIILGGWALSGRHWGGDQSTKDSKAAIRTAYKRGIRSFDSAEAYGNGISEQLIGQMCKKEIPRNAIKISTKTNYRPADKLEKHIDSSLKRLQTDYIDCYFIHWPKTGFELAPLIEELTRIKEKGKISAIGVSNVSIEDMTDALRGGRIHRVQNCFNALWPYDSLDLIPFCKTRSIAYEGYSSLAQGALTGKYPKTPDFDEADYRSKTRVFKNWQNYYPHIEQAKQQFSSPEEFTAASLNWALSHCDSIIIGARNKLQAESITLWSGYDITKTQLQYIENLSSLMPEYQGNLFYHNY